MKYISTRGGSEPVDFISAALAGLAPDGGLYCPEEYPHIDAPSAHTSYVETAARVLSAFAGDTLSEQVVGDLVEKAYAPFSHQAVAPLVQMGAGRWMMELHHGPTLAFKDIAMRMIAQLYDHVLTERGERMMILCATSGDTGGAAAAAFAGAKSVDLVILHPLDKISPVQRVFMAATGADNVFNYALEGDFDGTQSILKSLIGNSDFKKKVGLAAVNSINWSRVAAQSVYYAQAQAQFGADVPLQFVVPTGNFGDAFAGYVAHRCGLLAGFDFVAAVNANDTMVRLLSGEAMEKRETTGTISPAMDIQLPSNFERLLFEASGRDGAGVAQTYSDLAAGKSAALPDGSVENIAKVGLRALGVSDAQTKQQMKATLDETGWVVCPHTAVGLYAAAQVGEVSKPVVTLSTAHPAKFPETVDEVLKLDQPLPERASEFVSRKEVFSVGPMSETFVRDELLRIHSERS